MRTHVITSVSSPQEDRDAWKRAAAVAGVSLSWWMREALNAGAVATLADNPNASPVERAICATTTYQPPTVRPLPLGATSAPEVVDMERGRHRGWVSAFINIGGREWKGPGPTPLEPGCTIRADVLAEYAGKLAMLREGLMDQQREDNLARAMGVPA